MMDAKSVMILIALFCIFGFAYQEMSRKDLDAARAVAVGYNRNNNPYGTQTDAKNYIAAKTSGAPDLAEVLPWACGILILFHLLGGRNQT